MYLISCAHVSKWHLHISFSKQGIRKLNSEQNISQLWCDRYKIWRKLVVFYIVRYFIIV